MNGKAALTLMVAVVVGSVQVDWSGRTVTLSAGQQQAFAAEGIGRAGEGRRAQADDATARQSNKMSIVAVHKFIGDKVFLESFDGKTYEVVNGNRDLGRMPPEILYLEVTLVEKRDNGGTVEVGVWGTSPNSKAGEELQLKYLDQIIEKRKAMGLSTEGYENLKTGKKREAPYEVRPLRIEDVQKLMKKREATRPDVNPQDERQEP